MNGEQPLVIGCGAQRLIGILTLPQGGISNGVLILVGGPQYRVGSHRQFTLLARGLAAAGIPSLRFDYSGMGDSDGGVQNFENAAADIRCAIDAFMAEMPHLREIAIWGLCDAASAASFYAATDARVTRLVLLNPWVRTEAGAAKAYLRGYYLERLVDPNLWRKVARGEFEIGASLSSLAGMFRSAFGRQSQVNATETASSAAQAELPARMLAGLSAFKGKILLILSGDDLVADEFRSTVASSRAWRRLVGDKRVTQCDLAEADHTFSSRPWRDQVASWTIEWLRR